MNYIMLYRHSKWQFQSTKRQWSIRNHQYQAPYILRQWINHRQSQASWLLGKGPAEMELVTDDGKSR